MLRWMVVGALATVTACQSHTEQPMYNKGPLCPPDQHCSTPPPPEDTTPPPPEENHYPRVAGCRTDTTVEPLDEATLTAKLPGHYEDCVNVDAVDIRLEEGKLVMRGTSGDRIADLDVRSCADTKCQVVMSFADGSGDQNVEIYGYWSDNVNFFIAGPAVDEYVKVAP